MRQLWVDKRASTPAGPYRSVIVLPGSPRAVLQEQSHPIVPGVAFVVVSYDLSDKVSYPGRLSQELQGVSRGTCLDKKGDWSMIRTQEKIAGEYAEAAESNKVSQ